MQTETLLQELTNAVGPSGREDRAARIITDLFTNGEGRRWISDLHRDRLGNIILRKAGRGEQPPRIMLAAHLDEIGLIVTALEDGFIRFSTIGGIDQRVLLGQEVIVHGREDLPGVIGAKPPHLQQADEREKAVKIEEMTIDLGLAPERIAALVRVGDPITIKRTCCALKNSFYSGKAMDDRAGVVALVECLRRLKDFNHEAEVLAVVTVQEELGVRGAVVSSYGLNPDIGLAVDVTHGEMPGLPDYEAFKLGQGPVIVTGPPVHPLIFEKLIAAAETGKVKYQVEAAETPRGTDAYAIQIAQAGVASGLVCIPLRYMHTSVETLALDDLKETGRLLAEFIMQIDRAFLEGLECY
ncbi:MAG TPA: M42 family metallopeptidase [Firmicutes bacterium]|uniref:M20/M25/M40 family metallo-hydrolase n=1 Tax=Capillibacterium thermochitinicola TaxID=2699427 RepID=A0A8J6LIM0_9FIRM|nr:M20/M25/M40 family metallo-hydrolase [Capillibacterium thermochitinicola]HHW11718.1 M42 family metallopeptidase [Bacillota bacterium]